MENKIQDYLKSEQFVGLDRFLILQRRLYGYLAAKMGIKRLAPLGFTGGLLAGFLIFS